MNSQNYSEISRCSLQPGQWVIFDRFWGSPQETLGPFKVICRANGSLWRHCLCSLMDSKGRLIRYDGQSEELGSKELPIGYEVKVLSKNKIIETLSYKIEILNKYAIEHLKNAVKSRCFGKGFDPKNEAILLCRPALKRRLLLYRAEGYQAQYRLNKLSTNQLRVDLITQLPSEIAVSIFSYLPRKDLVACIKTSRSWATIATQDILWTPIAQQYGVYNPLKKSPLAGPIKLQLNKLFNVEFLYPCSNQFPFDDICRRIVLALEKRNWSVPGIRVQIENEWLDEITLSQRVEIIEGLDFEIDFSRTRPREQPIGTRIFDLVEVELITIGNRSLSVYPDESGPKFTIDDKCYCGSFLKPDEEPKNYHPNKGVRAPYVINEEGNDPTYYATDDLLKLFTRDLEEKVLKRIQ